MQQYYALTIHSIRLLPVSVFFKRFYTAWIHSGSERAGITVLNYGNHYASFPSDEKEVTAFMPSETNIGVFRRLSGIENDALAHFLEQLHAVQHAFVVA